MWPFKKKKTKPTAITYRLRPSDMPQYDHYVMEWYDHDTEEWVYIKVCPKDWVFMISNPKT